MFSYRLSTFSYSLGHVCYYSPVLKAAFGNPAFVESQTQAYRLEDVRPSCFKLFVQWIYTQQFDVFTNQELKGNQRPDESLTKDITKFYNEQDKDLSQLWTLADKFLIPKLQNEVMKKFCSKHRDTSHWSTHWFENAWENTASDSKLRRFIVHLCVRHVTAPSYKDNPEHFPRELLLQVASGLTLLKRQAVDKSQCVPGGGR